MKQKRVSTIGKIPLPHGYNDKMDYVAQQEKRTTVTMTGCGLNAKNKMYQAMDGYSKKMILEIVKDNVTPTIGKIKPMTHAFKGRIKKVVR